MLVGDNCDSLLVNEFLLLFWAIFRLKDVEIRGPEVRGFALYFYFDEISIIKTENFRSKASEILNRSQSYF